MNRIVWRREFVPLTASEQIILHRTREDARRDVVRRNVSQRNPEAFMRAIIAGADRKRAVFGIVIGPDGYWGRMIERQKIA